MSNSPMTTLYDTIEAMVSAMLSDVNTCMPGEIVGVADLVSKGLVDVKPLVKKRFTDGETLAMPTVYSVPVMYCRTSSDVGITFPLAKGDGVLLVFSQRSLDEWLDKGGEVDPRDNRCHDITDAIAIPGLFHSGAGSAIPDNTTVTVKYKSSTIVMKSNGDVEIKASGKVVADGSAIELGSGVVKKLINATLVTLYNAHTHNCASPGSPSGPPIVPLVEATVATSKTKAA